MRSKGITVDDTADQSTDISSPEANMGLHSWPRPVKSGKESMRFATHNTKFKFFKGNKRPRYATVVYGPVDEENASVFLEKSQKPKKINLQELLKGMKAFRFMSCFVAPGHLPETALIAALMDLVRYCIYYILFYCVMSTYCTNHCPKCNWWLKAA